MVSLGTISSVVLVAVGFLVAQILAADHKLIPSKAECDSSQWQCPNGGCIPLDDVCNCYKDCGDGADEKNCTDMLGASKDVRFFYPIYCPSGKCIRHDDICSGYEQCEDGSDERNCSGTAPCNQHQFECSNGKCISGIRQCDGFNDCDGDWSDEIDCAGKCNRFECNNGKCISEYRLCDCKDDCGDGSDENNCTDSIFHCSNDTCFSKSQVCDCINDCDDGMDERNCTGQTYQCPNGKCLLSSKLCNDNDDCGDGADEKNCHDFQFVCRQSGKIIKRKYLNDGFKDCEDGSDENYCSVDPFHCADGVCSLNSSLCENDHGCAKRSDEENCIGSCEEFQCPGTGACIHNNKVCDCTDDCGDGADEKNCKGLYNKLEKYESDTYLESYDVYKYHCANGECFGNEFESFLCDQSRQCSDWSDEMECDGNCVGFYCQNASDYQLKVPRLQKRLTNPKPCNGLQCPSGRCIPSRYQCDGIDDCGDWTDEKSCPDDPCTDSQFQCASGECIRKDFACKKDVGSFACRDGSNEENCEWRADLRCGDDHIQPYSWTGWKEKPAQCDPFGDYPCCSDKGWCGNSQDHCACPDCIDYRVCTDGSTYQTDNARKICTCVNGKYECKVKGCNDHSAKILEDGCNYCICINGTYASCTERTCISDVLLVTDQMYTEGSILTDDENFIHPDDESSIHAGEH